MAKKKAVAKKAVAKKAVAKKAPAKTPAKTPVSKKSVKGQPMYQVDTVGLTVHTIMADAGTVTARSFKVNGKLRHRRNGTDSAIQVFDDQKDAGKKLAECIKNAQDILKEKTATLRIRMGKAKEIISGDIAPPPLKPGK